MSSPADDDHALPPIKSWIPRPLAVHQELFFGGPKTADALIAALVQQGYPLTEDDLADLLDAG